MSGHVASDRLGAAAAHGDLSVLRDSERAHVLTCRSCGQLYGGYRLTDRLLSASWREVRLPESAPARIAPWPAFLDRLSGLDARRLAPGLAALAVVALVAAALGLPRLVTLPPSSTHSPAAAVSPTESGTPVATGSPASDASATSGSTGSAGATGKAGGNNSSGPPATPGTTALSLARIAGSPIAWSPDGTHLLVSTNAGRTIQIRDAAGRLNGSLTADSAAWVSSSTIVFATRSEIGPSATPSATASATHTSPSPSPTATTSPSQAHPSGVHWGGADPKVVSWRAASPGNGSGAAVTAAGPGPRSESVGLADVRGNVLTALPGSYGQWNGVAGGMLLGSGTGSFAVVSQGPGSSWRFELWAGSGGSASQAGSADGVPIAFSRDGSRLAVLHPGVLNSGATSGWLEIVSVPKLEAVASFRRLFVRAGAGSQGSAFGFDAAFSPDGRSLLVSGVLVNLAGGSAASTGDGGWLADGKLATASKAGLLRWSGSSSTLDSRFAGSGRAFVSRHGELIYVFDSGRVPLLLDTNGQLGLLSAGSVRSFAHLLISPTGRAIALDGRATDGSSIAAVAALP